MPTPLDSPDTPPDAIVYTFYRSPMTCRHRIGLMRSLNPRVRIVGIFSGDTKDFPRYKSVCDECDHFWCCPTTSTKDNWANLDRVYARWFVEQGRFLKLGKLLFIDWDVLLLESIDSLLERISPKSAVFSYVYPVRDLGKDHWATEFVTKNSLPNHDPLFPKEPLVRGILFVWGCTAQDLADAMSAILNLEGYCEMRLPYAFRATGTKVSEIPGMIPEFANYLGIGITRAQIHSLLKRAELLKLAHPVYTPYKTATLRVSILASLIELPQIKSIERKFKNLIKRLIGKK